jgi:hypothetical protein
MKLNLKEQFKALGQLPSTLQEAKTSRERAERVGEVLDIKKTPTEQFGKVEPLKVKEDFLRAKTQEALEAEKKIPVSSKFKVNFAENTFNKIKDNFSEFKKDPTKFISSFPRALDVRLAEKDLVSIPEKKIPVEETEKELGRKLTQQEKKEMFIDKRVKDMEFDFLKLGVDIVGSIDDVFKEATGERLKAGTKQSLAGIQEFVGRIATRLGKPEIEDKNILQDNLTELGNWLDRASDKNLEEARKVIETLEPFSIKEPENRQQAIAQAVVVNAPNMIGGLLVGAGAGVLGGPGAVVPAMFAYSAALEGGFARQEAEELAKEMDKDLSDKELDKIMIKVGVANGILETIAPASLLNRISKPVKGVLLIEVARNILQTGLEEAGTEFLQETVNNLVLREVDPERDVFAGSPEAGIVGGVSGGLIGGAGPVVTSVTRRGAVGLSIEDVNERRRQLEKKDELTPEEQTELAELRRLTIRNRKIAEKVIGKEPAPFVTRKARETTLLKERLRNLQRGAREGERAGRQTVEQRLDQINELVRNSGLRPENKSQLAVIPKQIAQVKSEKAFQRILNDKISQIERLEVAQKSRDELTKIRKTLKRTKIKKEAGKPVGKFTPEAQNILDSLREISTLSRENAQERLDKRLENKETPLPQETLENKFLAAISGREVSDLDSVLEEISDVISGAKEIRDTQIFNDFAEIESNKEYILERIRPEGKPPGRETTGRKRMTTKQSIRNSLRTFGKKWVMGWDGILDILDWNSSVHHKTLTRIFNVEKENSEYKRLQGEYSETLQNALVESYGIKRGGWSINKKISELVQKEVDLGEFENAVGEKVKIEMSKDELIKKYMEIQDDTLLESFIEGNHYTAEIIEAIDNSLTPQDKAFANRQMEMYRELYPQVNEIYRNLYGVDLPFNEFYSPIRREGFKVDTLEGFGEFFEEQGYRFSISPSSFKSRVKNILPVAKQGSIGALDRHFTEVNYFIAFGNKARMLNRVFGDTEVREAITEEFGGEMTSAVSNKIEDLTTNGFRHGRNQTGVDKVRKLFTFGALAAKPAIGIKQLVSILSYTEVMNPIEFTSGIIDFFKNPIKNARIFDNESPFLKQRGSNMERDVKALMKTDELKRFSRKQTFMNLLMVFVRMGDKGAIQVGSWAYRRKLLKDGVSLDEAINKYEHFGNSTQQSADPSQLSEAQIGTALEKLITMFKSSQNMYFRKEVNAIKSLFQKDGFGKKNIAKVARVLAIYHFLLPMVFQWISDFGRWDEDEQKRAAILGSLNGFFIVGDIIDGIIRGAIGLRVWDNELPFFDVRDDILRALNKVDLENLKIDEVLEAMLEFSKAGNVIGLPVDQTFNITGGVKDAMEGDVKTGIGRMLGWSEYMITGKLSGRGGGATFKPSGGDSIFKDAEEQLKKAFEEQNISGGKEFEKAEEALKSTFR